MGARLLAIPEDQWFERKSAKINPKDLAKPLTAFANAEGGTLVIGLHDGKVEGLQATPDRINALRQSAIDFTVPPVRVKSRQINCINQDGRTDILLVVRVDPGEVVHESKNGDVYLRVGDESRKLNFVARQELEYDKGQSQYDGRPAHDASLTNLDQRLLENYRSSTGASGTVEQVLAARSLLTPKGHLTNAAYLLFHPRPHENFPQAYIRIIRFLSSERGTGKRLGVEDDSDVRIEGPIPSALHRADKEIQRLIFKRRALSDAGLFEATPIVPRDVWLEGLVNAAIHRSYSLGGDHIRVEIYPDRVEIESPGRFPGLANPSSPLEVSRFARNPRIARVCADLRIGQELGEGIKRMFEEMRRVNLRDPIYKQTSGSVRLVLTSVPRLLDTQMSRLPPGSQQVLDVLKGAGRALGTGDIADAIGLSRPATKKRLDALRAEGLIEWQGKSARDPRASWRLTDG
ncbi:helix-turn-helix domain-containing protein [Naumannella sp. ID2617S]|nr:helix-turn-helix domain-containing protein [Naumannella sp. ID2617S]